MPSAPDPTLATQLLQRSDRDDDGHAAELLELVGGELRRLAAGYLKRERAGHTLQPTALVHEAYLKLIDSTVLVNGDRERFLALAARAMRQVLIDFARKHKAARRGGADQQRVTLHPELLSASSGDQDLDLIDLEDALTRLADVHELSARVVELRYFGGLTLVEAGEILGVSDSMVNRYWRTAQAWLKRELGRGDGS